MLRFDELEFSVTLVSRIQMKAHSPKLWHYLFDGGCCSKQHLPGNINLLLTKCFIKFSNMAAVQTTSSSVTAIQDLSAIIMEQTKLHFILNQGAYLHAKLFMKKNCERNHWHLSRHNNSVCTTMQSAWLIVNNKGKQKSFEPIVRTITWLRSNTFKTGNTVRNHHSTIKKSSRPC
jgi:hypothetical protein